MIIYWAMSLIDIAHRTIRDQNYLYLATLVIHTLQLLHPWPVFATFDCRIKIPIFCLVTSRNFSLARSNIGQWIRKWVHQIWIDFKRLSSWIIDPVINKFNVTIFFWSDTPQHLLVTGVRDLAASDVLALVLPIVSLWCWNSWLRRYLFTSGISIGALCLIAEDIVLATLSSALRGAEGTLNLIVIDLVSDQFTGSFLLRRVKFLMIHFYIFSNYEIKYKRFACRSHCLKESHKHPDKLY